MSALYKLVLRNSAGAKVRESRDFYELAYRKEVNAPGLLTFRLREDHPFVGQLGEDYQVEVWRANPALGLDWYADFRGLFVQDQWNTRQATSYTVTAAGQMSLLGRRIIAFPANQPGKTAFTNVRAETLLKMLVGQNTANTAGRDRNGAFAGKTIVASIDQARGSLVSRNASRKNLLTELQAVAEVAGGDFNLSRTGPATWTFEFYPGQLGSDRSGSVVFGLERGNMAAPNLVQRPASFNVAIVAGQGRDDSRDVIVVGSGDIEGFIDGRNDTDTASLTTRGQIALQKAAAVSDFSFDILQTATCYYGLHYNLGDLVQAEYKGFSAALKVRAVSVSVRRGEPERVDVETK